MRNRNRRPKLALAIVAALAALGVSSPALLPAQGTLYTLTADARYDTGCLEPSPCDCLPEVVGPIVGSFRLVPLLPPLGPVFEYAIVDFSATVVQPAGPVIPVAGAGTLVVDLAAGTQDILLTADVGGLTKTFSTPFGPAALNAGFPDEIDVDVFEPVIQCIIDGIRLRAEIEERFIRGDVDQSGNVGIGDAIGVLAVIFPSGGPPPVVACEDALDANDDALVNIADAIALLTGLFAGGSPPPAPFPACGTDPTPDPFGCDAHAACP